MQLSTSELIKELTERVDELDETIISIHDEVEDKKAMLETMKYYYSNKYHIIDELDDELHGRMDYLKEFIAEHDALKAVINHYRSYNIY